MITITLDTDVLPADDLIEAAHGLDCEFAVVSVTRREVDGTSFVVYVEPLGGIHETAVFGQAKFGSSVFGSRRSHKFLEKILSIISSGSFPESRDNLSVGQVHQLRDALILEAHLRKERDILSPGMPVHSFGTVSGKSCVPHSVFGFLRAKNS